MLRFVMYIEGSTRVRLEKTRPPGVTLKDGDWHFRGETYSIGSGVRVPMNEDGLEPWGPMMVIDIHNPIHFHNCARAIWDLQNRCLVP